MNYFDFNNRFKTELDVIKHFISQKYPNGIYCHKCGAISNVSHRHTSPIICRCNNCNSEFSIFANTIFEKSDTDLRKRFLGFIKKRYF